MDSLELHRAIAEGPYEAQIGSALITMVEPHEGFDRDYNRWYEDDHFISGALAMPWMFAGRRFVAPKRLQGMRAPDNSPIANPLALGKYISLYWIIEGRQNDQAAHSTAINRRLRADDRILLKRDHIYTSFQTYRGAVYRDDAVVRDIHILNYPFGGHVLEVIDAVDGQREALIDWLKADYIPSRLKGSDMAVATIFTPIPLPADKMPDVADIPGIEDRVTILWFSDHEPERSFDALFGMAEVDLVASGKGKLAFVAPFVPTFHGTDRYVDELR
ncbi:hypothetical protein FYJ91_01030 [Sphingomonas montanisoli]|uniref:Uncharacterized protein n=2 Tax=Sphingomonas montanisoli TaxID=2606412 RepID=A0A5D9CHV9_9SPHN|nr:hypothetical protein FYJ91_01030 [Sphingomonas montanisoli]